MAQVTTAFGMGSPALSRTTARICSERPTRNCESSERMWTMAGVWAAAVAAASRPTKARMASLAACDRGLGYTERQAEPPVPPLLGKDFLHGAEATITGAVDVVIAAARRCVVDCFGPVDS